MSLTLRAMEPRDVPAVAAIDKLSFPTPWPESAFYRELKRERATYLVLLHSSADGPDEPGHGEPGHGEPGQKEPGQKVPGQQKQGWLQWLFGSVQDSRVIGYVGFRLEGGAGHITTIALRPEWRGRGLGELLLLTALERIVEQGVDAATLEMRPSNDVAHQLYRKYGFEIVKSRWRYYRDGEDAWVMAADVGDEDYDQRLSHLRQSLENRLDQQAIDVGQIIDQAL